MAKLPLWHERKKELQENNTNLLTDDEILEKLKKYHNDFQEFRVFLGNILMRISEILKNLNNA